MSSSTEIRTANRLGRWIVWLAPVLLLVIAQRSTLIFMNPPPTSSDDHFRLLASFNSTATYLLVSKPQNLISINILQKLDPATVYWAYPPSEADYVTTGMAKTPESTQFCEFDPFGETRQQVMGNFMECLKKLPTLIDGVIINLYGAVGDGTLSQHAMLVQQKLTTPLEVLQILIDQTRLTTNARIVFSGSESARGLPRLGFPVPQLGESVESIRSLLSGDAYEASTYRWESAYADLSAVLVLHLKHLSTLQPHLYMAVVSPGMTDESLRAENSPARSSLFWRWQLWAYRNLFFGVLSRWEIAKTSAQGANLLLNGLSPEYSYSSGAFVAAMSGTGGPVGDQTLLPGGKMFLDERLQKLAYEAVQQHMQKKEF